MATRDFVASHTWKIFRLLWAQHFNFRNRSWLAAGVIAQRLIMKSVLA
jgi:hypothetical protein